MTTTDLVRFIRSDNTPHGSSYDIVISNGYDTKVIGTITRHEYCAPHSCVGWVLDMGDRLTDCDTLTEAKDIARDNLLKAMLAAYAPRQLRGPR